MKIDLHVHSRYSRDAAGSPAELVKQCRKNGLDGLAITDHNAIAGSLEAYSLAKAEGVLVVRGVEVSTVDGHVLAFGVADLVPRGLSIEETIERVHSAGGVCVASHPERFPSGIGLELAGAHRFDGIEILNSGSSARSNKLAKRLAESKGCPVTGGSDAHAVDQLARAYTVVESASSEDDIIEAIKKGRTSVAGRSRTRVEGMRYSMEVLVAWMSGHFGRL